MYAVFEDGSRQYRVSEGELVRLDYREVEPGNRLEIDRVLLIQGNQGTEVGRPFISGARIVAEVVEHPSTKLYIQHFRRRKNYRRYNGHRQHYTAVKISHILMPGQDAPPPPAREDAKSPPAPAREPASAPAGGTPAKA
jgi:large subunit ribosomal protein L21